MASKTFQPAAAVGLDTYFNSFAPTTNYGTNVRLGVGEHPGIVAIARTWLKFSQLSDGTIPKGSIINSATLSLYVALDESNNVRTLRVYRCKRVVVEAQATWNIYSTGNNWQTAGASGANDREAADIGSVSITHNPPIGTEYQITLAAAKIQEMIEDGVFTNNGFILQVDTENADLIYYDSSDGVTAGERPKLVIVYTSPAFVPRAIII